MAYDIRISQPQRRALFDLRGTPQALAARLQRIAPNLPTRPCSLVRQGKSALMWLGPARWWLMAPPDAEAELEAILMQEPHGHDAAITLISDTQAFFTLSGQDAVIAMSIACPLDLHPTAFAEDSVAQTDAFGLRALVLREDHDWLLGIEPSYAEYVEAQLRQIV
ncbi:MAG: sarcosine oxidase subunit gamma family protein [Roseinatronobacter sp.]